jgi:hypothetical protein
MGRLRSWVKLGVVVFVASLTLGTATVAASASMNQTPIPLVHVH